MFIEESTTVPFKVLKYTVGEINYGGRVTDDWDRRLIMSILQDFYTPKVLEDGYRFSTSPTYYSIPGDDGYLGYRNYIKSLPIDETTEIFSMHDNANITFAQKETFTLFENLTALMPRSSSGAGGKGKKVKAFEEVLTESANYILEKVAKPFDLDAVMSKYPVDYKESMSTVLVQEVLRFNTLLALVHSSLNEVLRALKGLVVMSSALENICNKLFVNQVPQVWTNKAYPSLKPLSSWVLDLCERTEFIQNWINNGIPTVFWISGFFFPQAFLTGTLQNFARKNVVSIDLLSFDFKPVDMRVEDISAKPDDGCYIRGLYLEGARWDSLKRTLIESRPKELYTEMSVIWLLPKKNRKKQDEGIYDCPVYKTLTRAGI